MASLCGWGSSEHGSGVLRGGTGGEHSRRRDEEEDRPVTGSAWKWNTINSSLFVAVNEFTGPAQNLEGGKELPPLDKDVVR